MNRSYTTPFAVVIGNDVSVWGSDESRGTRACVGLAYDLPGTLDMLSRYCEQRKLTEVPVIFDTDTPFSEFTRQADALRAAGWHFTDMRAWTRIARSDTVFYLGIRSEFTVSRVPLYDGLDGVDAIHAAAVGFHRALGQPFWGAPGMVGCELIRKHNPRGPREPRWVAPLPLAVKPAGPLHWQSDIPALRPVVALDVNAAYLAAAGVAEVAADALEHSTDSQYYPGRAGYWHVEFDQCERLADLVISENGLSAFDWRRVGPDGRAWITAPVAREVLATGGHGVPWRIVESWTAPGVRGVLRPWAEQIRGAYVATWGEGSTVERAVKRVYKDTTGMLARQGGRVFRPDWAHHIIDLARMNLLRKVWHASSLFRRNAPVWGGQPRLVAVNVDEVQYELCGTATAADVLAALNRANAAQQARHPGAMKLAREIDPDTWAAEHSRKRGRP